IQAGIEEGMHVLDVGTGRGDVAFIAAELVGETGSVVGIDSAPAAIAVARERAAADSQVNVSFEEGDPAAFTPRLPLDAIVGRYVLQFLAAPAAVLRLLRAICGRAESSRSTRSTGPGIARIRRCRSGTAAAAW